MLGTESYQKIRDCFTEGSIWTVTDLADKTKLSKGTVRTAIRALESAGIVRKGPYKQRQGQSYLPVAVNVSAYRVGKDYKKFEELITYLCSEERSPFIFITQDKWDGLRKTFLQAVFVDHDDRISTIQIRSFLNLIQQQAGDFMSLVTSFSGEGFWSTDNRDAINSDIVSKPSSLNTYEDTVNRLAGKKAA